MDLRRPAFSAGWLAVLLAVEPKMPAVAGLGILAGGMVLLFWMRMNYRPRIPLSSDLEIQAACDILRAADALAGIVRRASAYVDFPPSLWPPEIGRDYERIFPHLDDAISRLEMFTDIDPELTRACNGGYEALWATRNMLRGEPFEGATSILVKLDGVSDIARKLKASAEARLRWI
jgi:hypothetical protein